MSIASLRDAGADGGGERLLQDLRHDRLAAGLCLRPRAHPQGDDQDPPERHYERPTTSQYAAIVALRECDNEIERMREEYNMRRRLVVKGFNDMGLTCFEPQGAFYAFPCIKSTGMTSQEFCTTLLEEKHVALVPGDRLRRLGGGLLPRILRLLGGPSAGGPAADPRLPSGTRPVRRPCAMALPLQKVSLLAPAKLNLSLDVVGILPGGYHALDMVMQAVSLYEQVTLRRSPDLVIRLPGSRVTPGPKNTAYKAALAFFHYTGLLAGWRSPSARASRCGPAWGAALRMPPRSWWALTPSTAPGCP